MPSVWPSIVGHVVAGRYRVVDLLGEGGIGQVYRAEHVDLQTPFAVKVLRPEFADNETAVGRFKREALALSRLRHPAIVYVTDFGRLEDGRLYLVMEYLQGESLQDMLNTRGALPLTEALAILVEVASGMVFAHQHNVIHRDLKPDNIMMVEVPGPPHVKIIDFGLAKAMDETWNLLTAEGIIPGTPTHMAPELTKGLPADNRSDIYAFGITTYEAITRTQPFHGNAFEIMLAHRNVAPEIPSERAPDGGIFPELDALVMGCLRKNPATRYQSFEDVLADVRICEQIAQAQELEV